MVRCEVIWDYGHEFVEFSFAPRIGEHLILRNGQRVVIERVTHIYGGTFPIVSAKEAR